MVDNLILLTTHALLVITAWRLINRPDLDDESAGPVATKHPWGKKRGA